MLPSDVIKIPPQNAIIQNLIFLQGILRIHLNKIRFEIIRNNSVKAGTEKYH
jgi:hypothetical protein